MAQTFLEMLATRRSVKAAALTEPGPTPAELEQILTVAARVPDHKKVEPWRFILFEGETRAKFGEVIADACKAEDKMPPSEARLETERQRLFLAARDACPVGRPARFGARLLAFVVTLVGAHAAILSLGSRPISSRASAM